MAKKKSEQMFDDSKQTSEKINEENKQLTINEFVFQLIRESRGSLTPKQIKNRAREQHKRELSSTQITRATQALSLSNNRRIIKDKDGSYFVPSQAEFRYEQRKLIATEQKREVAQNSVSLIFGGIGEESIEECETKRGIILEQFRGASESQSRLRSIYNSRERIVIIDGGSTGYYIAEALWKVIIPAAHHGVWSLRVITNCPDIGSEIMKRPFSADVSLLGGRASRDTNYISGQMSERVFDAWHLTSDIALLGASSISSRWGCCSHSEDEASMKKKLFAHSIIRCIAVDSTKIEPDYENSSSIAFCFAPLSPTVIDAVITDSGVHQKTKFCSEMQDRKIAIIALEK